MRRYSPAFRGLGQATGPAVQLTAEDQKRLVVTDGLPTLNAEYAEKAWKALEKRELNVIESGGGYESGNFASPGQGMPAAAPYLKKLVDGGATVIVGVPLADPSYVQSAPNCIGSDLMWASYPPSIPRSDLAQDYAASRPSTPLPSCAAVLPPRSAFASVSPVLLVAGGAAVLGLGYWYFKKR